MKVVCKFAIVAAMGFSTVALFTGCAALTALDYYYPDGYYTDAGVYNDGVVIYNFNGYYAPWHGPGYYSGRYWSVPPPVPPKRPHPCPRLPKAPGDFHPNRPDNRPNRPDVRPDNRPDRPAVRPDHPNKPGGSDRPNIHPNTPPSRPNVRPSSQPSRPSRPAANRPPPQIHPSGGGGDHVGGGGGRRR